MHCPDCDDLLIPATTRGAHARTCEACAGFWLDFDACERILPAAEVGLRAAARSAGHLKPVASARACPVCRLGMQRLLVTAAGVVLDVCPRDGTWFEAQEIFYVLRALREARRTERRSTTGGPYRGGAVSAEPLRLVHVRRDIDEAKPMGVLASLRARCWQK